MNEASQSVDAREPERMYASAGWLKHNLGINESRLLGLITAGAIHFRANAGKPAVYSVEDAKRWLKEERRDEQIRPLAKKRKSTPKRESAASR